MKVFLGGTCGNSNWRSEVMRRLDDLQISYFNPVVEDWTTACQIEEVRQKELCNIHLYIITKEMIGAFSIAEAIDSAHQKNKICVFQVLPEGFNPSQIKSFKAVANLIKTTDPRSFIYFGSGLLITCGAIRDLGARLSTTNTDDKCENQNKGWAKTLKNTDADAAKKNVSDIVFWGDGDLFQLICKASSEQEGWMKSTKAMQCGNDVVVQVTTQQRNPDGSYAIAEALTTVPNARVLTQYDENGIVTKRSIQTN